MFSETLLSAYSLLDQNAESLKRLGFPVPLLLFPMLISRWPPILKGKHECVGMAPRWCLLAAGIRSPRDWSFPLSLVRASGDSPASLLWRSCPEPRACTPSSFFTMGLLCGLLFPSWRPALALNSEYVTRNNWEQPGKVKPHGPLLPWP